MFDGIEREPVESLDVIAEAREAAAGAAELSASTWNELLESDEATRVIEGAQGLADSAWSAASAVQEIDPGAYVEEGARNVVYVGGRAVLGAGKLGESALKAVGAAGAYAISGEEAAVEVAQASVMEGLAENLGDALQVSEEVRQVGDKAEVVGEIAGGIGLSVAATALAPEAMAGAAAIGVDAVFALGAAGETLEARSEDGDLSGKDVAIAGGAAVGSVAAGVAINKVAGKVISHIAGGAAAGAAINEVDEVAHAVAGSADDVSHALTGSVDEVAEAMVSNTDEIAAVATGSVDDVVDAVAASTDGLATAITSEVDDAARIAASESDEVAQSLANEANDIAMPIAAETDDVARAVSGEADDAVETVENLICRNESLAGDVHPMSGVPFERRVIRLEDGRVIEGVFPKFDSVFDAKIPRELFEASNITQFKECSRQFMKALEENPELKAKYTAEFLEQLADGCSTGAAPDGFVWHHDAAEGVIQLVDSATHTITGHTGGRLVWGGGY